jgi:hypothetical protein
MLMSIPERFRKSLSTSNSALAHSSPYYFTVISHNAAVAMAMFLSLDDFQTFGRPKSVGAS